MKKILVTGAVGQVGRFLVSRLSEKKMDFLGLDIKISDLTLDFPFLRADLRKKSDLNRIKSYLKEYNVVVHLASKINADQDVIKNGIESIDLNIKTTLNLFECLPNLEHFCFVSTYMVYGIPKAIPVTEEHPTEPINIYGSSKLLTEKYLQVFARQYEITLSILRFMGIYGLERPYAVQAIPSFIRLMSNNQNPIIFGNGQTRRNHIYIDDAIEAILIFLEKRKSGVFNIGGPEAPTNLDLINLINEIMEKKIIPKFEKTKDKQFDFIVDISKIRKQLGFKPRVGIKKGLFKAIRRFTEQDNIGV